MDKMTPEELDVLEKDELVSRMDDTLFRPRISGIGVKSCIVNKTGIGVKSCIVNKDCFLVNSGGI